MKFMKLNHPLGTKLFSGVSEAIVTAYPFDISERLLGIVENKRLLGFATFASPLVINVRTFKKYYELHRISEPDRKRLWPSAGVMYLYKAIDIFRSINIVKLKPTQLPKNRKFWEIDRVSSGMRVCRL